MNNDSARAGAQQALVATSTTQSLLPQSPQPLAVSGDVSPSTAPDNRAARLAFLAAGTLLGLASIAIAALNGWSRGASLAESLVWAAAGIALALVSLFGLSLVLANHGQARATAGIAWLLGLTFTVVAALGSQHGGRELAGRLDGAATGDRVRFEADHKRAAGELALLPATRPAGVIDQELATPVLMDSRLKGCSGWLESWRLRKVCADKVAPLRAEQAIAADRARLQTAMAAASAALGTATVGKPANSDANAMQRYLAAIGIYVGAERLADILNLLTVLAVEFCGSCCAGTWSPADCRSRQGPCGGPACRLRTRHESAGWSSARPKSAARSPNPLSGCADIEGPASSAAGRRTLVIERLKAGALEGRQVDIADALGVPRTTLRRIVEADDRLRMIVGPQGSRLELV